MNISRQLIKLRTHGRARIGTHSAVLGLAALLAVGAAYPAQHGAADLILKNGKVITVDNRNTIASAVAVQGNRIVAVGDVSGWEGQGTRIIDLRGRALLPGFIDAHSHVEGMADTEAHFVNIQVPPLKDAGAIIQVLKRAQASKPPGAWIIGQGTYNQVMPTRAQLDAAFPDNPIRLDWSAHDHLINHKAAMLMGMTKDFPDPGPGVAGRYERLSNGEVMIVRDAPAPWPKVEQFTYPQLKEGVRNILEKFYLERGVTTVSDMSSPETYHAYQELRAEGRLPTRVRINYFISNGVQPGPLGTRLTARDLAATGLFTGMGDDWIRLGAIKIILDGVWGTTAAVYKPFWNGSGTTWIPDNRGGTAWTQQQLNEAVLEAHRAGWQIQVHANGDRAQDMVLDAYEAAQRAFPRQDARDRIEHFGHFLVQDARTEERLERMVRDHVIPSPQPAFLWRLTNTNIKEPDVKFFAMKTLIARGLHPAGGVDTIGTQNYATYPLFSIARAVHRDTKYGAIVQPDEAISVMDAIRMFTIWSAQANFLDHKLGSIEVGKLADFVVLASDPLTTPADRLSTIPVDMTVLDGKVAYERR
jgi:predicted amidohydrolase YtcJ